MPKKISAAEASYFLGFDGGGTKTDCVLADAEGRVVARATAGPSNPLRAGYTRAWFSLSDAADSVLKQEKIKSGHIRGICAGLGGAGPFRRRATRDDFLRARISERACARHHGPGNRARSRIRSRRRNHSARGHGIGRFRARCERPYCPRGRARPVVQR